MAEDEAFQRAEDAQKVAEADFSREENQLQNQQAGNMTKLEAMVGRGGVFLPQTMME